LATDCCQRIDSDIRSNRAVEILGYRDPAYGAYPLDDAHWLEEPIGEMGRLAGEAIIRRVADPLAKPQRTVLRASYAPQGFSRPAARID